MPSKQQRSKKRKIDETDMVCNVDEEGNQKMIETEKNEESSLTNNKNENGRKRPKFKANDKIVNVNAEDESNTDTELSHSESRYSYNGTSIDEDNLQSEKIDRVQGNEKKQNNDKLRKEAIKYRDDIENRGVIYLSSIPMMMRPDKVKHLLSQYGEITRMHIEEEDAAARKKRLRNGGNKKKRYVEGWVEFKSKKIAKEIAAYLNGNSVGGKKRNFFYDDVWNMKYLKGFKWYHLTEKREYERNVRREKLRLEVMQARKEANAYLDLIEQRKKFDGMKKKREEKLSKVTDDRFLDSKLGKLGTTDQEEALMKERDHLRDQTEGSFTEKKQKKIYRTFKQKQSAEDRRDFFADHNLKSIL